MAFYNSSNKRQILGTQSIYSIHHSNSFTLPNYALLHFQHELLNVSENMYPLLRKSHLMKRAIQIIKMQGITH